MNPYVDLNRKRNTLIKRNVDAYYSDNIPKMLRVGGELDAIEREIESQRLSETDNSEALK